MKKTINPDLVRAYREARYEVQTSSGPFSMGIGRVSTEAASAMRESAATTAAFLAIGNSRHKEAGHLGQLASVQDDLAGEVRRLGLSGLVGEEHDRDVRHQPRPGLLVLGISLIQAEEMASNHDLKGFVWIENQVGLPALKLLHALHVPSEAELTEWRTALPADEATAAELLSRREQAAVMTVPREQRRHWLLPDLWDITKPWPLARPDGGAMGVGTELDRMFKLVAAGICFAFTEYAD